LVPLQTGDLTSPLMIATGIVFFAVVVILVLYALRRTTRMSDELSTQWEEKLRTIKPTTTTQTAQFQGVKQPSPLSEQRSHDSVSYTLLQLELRETKTRIQNCLQEILTLKQSEATMRREVQSLKAEVATLQERLRTSRDELRDLRTSIDVSAKPQDYVPPRDLPTLDAQLVEGPAQPAPQVRRPSSIFGRLFQRRVCSNCGRGLGSKDRYCDSCGRPSLATR
jgi:FtsZ-binding cell division protein ZapB